MRILVVTQYFWPENFRINDLCTELTSRGHEVTVLTGLPNYPQGRVFSEYQQSPDSYSSYNSCSIVRVPIVARGQGSKTRLLFNYISYVLSASVIGMRKLGTKSFDVIFVYEPSPVTVCLPAIFIKSQSNIPVVFWVLDLWPETLEAIGIIKSPRILALVGRLVRYIYNRCDLVLGQSKAFHHGISRYCDDHSKIRYFPSWSEANFLSGSKNQKVDEVAKHKQVFRIVFAGNIGEAQDFPSIIRAFQLLKQDKVKARLFVLGDGRAFDSVKSEITKAELDEYIVMMGRHPLESMPAFYASADALLVTLKESKAFSMTIPGKVQTYMAAGKPLLSMLTGEGSRIIEEAQCGLTANSGDYALLAENIEEMASYSSSRLARLSENASSYARREFDRDHLISKLENWFHEVIRGKQALTR